MDERLKRTAHSGDINALYTLIHDDPNVLKRIDEMEFVHTPLHESAISGKTDFAMEIMNLKPSFARKLDPNGLSPIHLALQNQQTETVTEFISVDKDLIRVKGRDGFTVLHHVASHENVDLQSQFLSQFLDLCPDSIFDLTTRRQTALHVATENNRSEALEALVKWIETQVEDNSGFLRSKILNSQDKDGNTALHLAAANNQPQMIKLLIECKEIDKNKINRRGLKASDLCTRESLRILNSNPPMSVMNVFSLGTRLTDSVRKMKPETINALLVVLALIQTMTYQALFSPPGGVSQGGAAGSNQREGRSVMNSGIFLLFYISNGVAFLISLTITLTMLGVVVKSYKRFLLPLYCLIVLCYGVATIGIIAPSTKYGLIAFFGAVIILAFYISYANIW